MTKHVFLLAHVHELSPEQEDVKIIGIYSTQAQAEAAQKRAKRLPGFKDVPEGFSIDAYELDEDNWVEGFWTYVPPSTAEAERRRTKPKPRRAKAAGKVRKRS
jgi:hypothetical protein